MPCSVPLIYYFSHCQFPSWILLIRSIVGDKLMAYGFKILPSTTESYDTILDIHIMFAAQGWIPWGLDQNFEVFGSGYRGIFEILRCRSYEAKEKENRKNCSEKALHCDVLRWFGRTTSVCDVELRGTDEKAMFLRRSEGERDVIAVTNSLRRRVWVGVCSPDP